MSLVMHYAALAVLALLAPLDGFALPQTLLAEASRPPASTPAPATAPRGSPKAPTPKGPPRSPPKADAAPPAMLAVNTAAR